MRLSICIPTLNRAEFIGETLDSILAQIEDDIEVVVVDGGSRDRTADVVAQRASRCPRIRYHLSAHHADGQPTPSNEGYDRDCDRAIQLAAGRYCWILPDDDVVVPGGLARLRRYLDAGVALVVANAEVRTKDLTQTLEPRRLKMSHDTPFSKGQADQLFASVGGYLSYAGGVVVRRDWWLARDRQRHYGSGFVHLGVLFQAPSDLDAMVIAEPLIHLRYGNALWSSRAFELWMFQWPALVWSFPLSDAAKNAVTPRAPWHRARTLAFQRACGHFGSVEYERLLREPDLPTSTRLGGRLVLRAPAWVLNALWLALLRARSGSRVMDWFDLWHAPSNSIPKILERLQRPSNSTWGM